MPFDYITAEDAIARDGLRMVVVRNVPSPWGEAAKGIFHMKEFDWAAVSLAYDDPKLTEWMGGGSSAPVAIHGNEAPRSGWAEILLLAERLASDPALVPTNAIDRSLMFGLAHELMGEEGLGWARRLQLVDVGMRGEGGFPEPIAAYIGGKYGYTPECSAGCHARVVDLLTMLASRLQAQADAGSAYYIGDGPTAVDIYSATIMALFSPLPEDQCAMNPHTRTAFNTMDDDTRAAFDPILITHRDRMYADHLELPLSL
ncbi:MAG: hypothetical protein AAF253_08095 [Pseudomonadota bacterium]